MSADSRELLEILDAHGAELHALFTRLTLRAGPAEDLLQELFLKLRNAAGLAAAINQKAYVFRAAMHLAFDWWRSQRPTEPLVNEPLAAMGSPLDGLMMEEELEQVLQAMQSLSDLGRQTVVLRFLQQQDYPEIARQLGKSEHQARALCAKAVSQLRVILGTSKCLPEREGSVP